MSVNYDGEGSEFLAKVRTGRARFAALSSSAVIGLFSMVLVLSANAGAVTFVPPFSHVKKVSYHAVSNGGCAGSGITHVSLTTGATVSNTSVATGTVFPYCPTAWATSVEGFLAGGFQPTAGGAHKAVFKWQTAWQAWLNSTCRKSNCSQANGSLLLVAHLFDRSTGQTVGNATLLLWSGSSANGTHRVFVHFVHNYTLTIPTIVNSTHAYALETFLFTWLSSSAPAGGLRAAGHLNVGTGLYGARLVSMSL
jgi:hypothetical protein